METYDLLKRTSGDMLQLDQWKQFMAAMWHKTKCKTTLSRYLIRYYVVVFHSCCVFWLYLPSSVMSLWFFWTFILRFHSIFVLLCLSLVVLSLFYYFSHHCGCFYLVGVVLHFFVDVLCVVLVRWETFKHLSAWGCPSYDYHFLVQARIW